MYSRYGKRNRAERDRERERQNEWGESEREVESGKLIQLFVFACPFNIVIGKLGRGFDENSPFQKKKAMDWGENTHIKLFIVVVFFLLLVI